MRANGSPEARFDFDENRSYFRATLPVHPRYAAAHLWVAGEKKEALQLLLRRFEGQPDSPGSRFRSPNMLSLSGRKTSPARLSIGLKRWVARRPSPSRLWPNTFSNAAGRRRPPPF